MTDMMFSTPDLEPYLILAQELMRHVYAEDSPEEINGWLLAQVHRLSGEKDGSARLTWEDSFTLYEQIMAKRIAEAALPESERRLLDWPWETWSRYLDPLEPGMLALLAGADGSGKTLYGENLAEHWAKKGRNVVFVHFELNRALMLDRRTVRHTGIPRRVLRMAEMTSNQEVKRQRSNDQLRGWGGGITYLHTPGWTVEKMLSEVQRLIEDEVCDVFVVDYLEKAACSPRQNKLFGTNLYQREADDVERIKSFSEQTEVPVFMLAQLNKLGKGQAFGDLDRTAIRGAGEKTEKANVVILLHRESLESQIVKLRIDKNTIGPTGSFEQYMETSRFLVADIDEKRR